MLHYFAPSIVLIAYVVLSDNNGEWDIIKPCEEVFIRQRHPNSAQKFSFIKFTLLIQRRWVYYVLFLILPCVLCTLLVLVSFAIPPENGERIGFCSTIMIAVSVYLLLIADMLPEKSDTLPILGVYYTITMMLIACALMATIMVLRAYHSTSEPPACVKALYRACKAKKKTKLENKGKIKMKKLLKRNAVASELPPEEIDAEAASLPQVPPSHDSDSRDRHDSDSRPIVENNQEFSEEEKRKMWRAIAVSFDRFFFWLFLLIFLSSTGYLMKFRPIFRFSED